MQPWMKLTAIFAGLGVVGWAVWSFLHPAPESNPIVANGEDSVVVLPFSTLQDVTDLRLGTDLPLGWVHEPFWLIRTMILALEEKQGKQAISCETNGTASILSRTTDIEIGDYPILTWDWLIDLPLTSTMDETTPEGDDHPARILIDLESREGEPFGFEIIWGNRSLKSGDYLTLNGTAHYVANGLDENTKVWQHQEVDLMEVYRAVTGRDDYPIMKRIAIMCDSDNTNERSVAFFTDVALQSR